MKTVARELAFIATTTSAEFIGPSPKRRALILNSSATGIMTYSLTGAAVIGQGLRIPASGAAVILTRHDIGDAICGPLSGICSIATQAVGIIEVIDVD